jgi:dolichol kinase
VEGSVAFLGSVLVSTIFLWAFGAVGNFRVSPLRR